VFLLGLVSCGKKNDQPKCEEIKGIGFVWYEDGVFRLPRDCGELKDEGGRYVHPKFKKYKNYTGIL